MEIFDTQFLIPFLLGGGSAWAATIGYHLQKIKEIKEQRNDHE